MRKCRLLCVILSLSLMSQWNSQFMMAKAKEVIVNNETEAASTSQTFDYVDNELLVTYKTDSGTISSLPNGVEEENITDTCSLFTVEEDSGMIDTLKAIAADPDVQFVEPNYTVELLNTNDTYSDKQWAYYNPNSNINAQSAWALGRGEDNEVIVAVIDTGIDYQHADLAKNIWKNIDESYTSMVDRDGNEYPGDYYGWNFADSNSVICNYETDVVNGEPVAVDYHGTHIAGIIDAVADNGKGIAGLASYSNVKVMSVKVMGQRRSGVISDIVKAIAYAENNGATICNLSLGTDAYSEALYQAMKDSSMLFICAAGNGDENTDKKGYDISVNPVFPASFDLDNIISVANANSTGALDDSSCYSDSMVDIAAPGTDIASCYVDLQQSEIGSYVASTGTSMAAPFVTATAAMLSSYYTGLSALEIRQMILGGSKKVEALSSQVANGSYLDVYGAMTYNGLLASVTTSIKDITDSNNKKYVIQVNNPRSEELTLLYAKGEKDVAYFEGGENGTFLMLSNEIATLKVTKTSDYTIYIKDSTGNEAVYTDKITVPTLTKMKLASSKKTLGVGDTYRIKKTLSTTGVYADITYKSSNTNIAKVSSLGTVRAKKKGSAIITVTAKYGSVKKTATCKIVVK